MYFDDVPSSELESEEDGDEESDDGLGSDDDVGESVVFVELEEDDFDFDECLESDEDSQEKHDSLAPDGNVSEEVEYLVLVGFCVDLVDSDHISYIVVHLHHLLLVPQFEKRTVPLVYFLHFVQALFSLLEVFLDHQVSWTLHKVLAYYISVQ